MPVVVSQGAWVAALTPAAPALPASIVAGNLLVLLVAAKPENPAPTATGYTFAGSVRNSSGDAQGADTGSSAVTILTKTATASETAPSVVVSGGSPVMAAVIQLGPGTGEEGTPFVATYGGQYNQASTAIANWQTQTIFNLDANFNPQPTSTKIFDLRASDLLLSIWGMNGNATFASSAITVAAPAVTGAVTQTPTANIDTTVGNDGAASVTVALVTTGGSATITTGTTLSAARKGSNGLFQFRCEKRVSSSDSVTATNEGAVQALYARHIWKGGPLGQVVTQETFNKPNGKLAGTLPTTPVVGRPAEVWNKLDALGRDVRGQRDRISVVNNAPVFTAGVDANDPNERLAFGGPSLNVGVVPVTDSRKFNIEWTYSKLLAPNVAWWLNIGMRLSADPGSEYNGTAYFTLGGMFRDFSGPVYFQGPQLYQSDATVVNNGGVFYEPPDRVTADESQPRVGDRLRLTYDPANRIVTQTNLSRGADYAIWDMNIAFSRHSFNFQSALIGIGAGDAGGSVNVEGIEDIDWYFGDRPLQPSNHDSATAVAETAVVAFPTVATIELWENGVFKANLGQYELPIDGSSQLLDVKFDPKLLSGVQGAGVELRVSSPDALDIQAINWDATYVFFEAVFKTSSDSAVGLDAHALVAGVANGDTGSAGEFTSLTIVGESVSLNSQDSASGVDAQVANAFLVNTDAASATEVLQRIAQTSSDAATLVDVAYLLAQSSSSDTASSVEAQQLVLEVLTYVLSTDSGRAKAEYAAVTKQPVGLRGQDPNATLVQPRVTFDL